ncbi:MAG: hypothetical protein V1495_07710 [Pseudomonadota bacterium]
MWEQDSERPTSNFPFAVGLLVAIALFLVIGHWVWLKMFLMNAETSVARLARTVAPALTASQPADDEVYRNFIAQQPNVGYVVVADYRNGYRHGITNSNALRNSNSPVEEAVERSGSEKVLERMIRPGAGFAGEYLHVVSATFVPTRAVGDVTPFGVLKVGFVVPGYVRGFPPFGRGFWRVIAVASVVSGLSCAILMILGLGRAAGASAGFLPPVLSHEVEAKNELEWLEQDLDTEESLLVDQEGVSWKVLFSGASLDGWETKGHVYVSDGEMVLRPWGACAVQPAAGPGEFRFRVHARKIAGPDGFVILFPCDKRSLAWVIGGWGNRRSELVGIPGTSRDSGIEKNRWYQIDVEVGRDAVEGFLDDVSIWKTHRAEIRHSSPEGGFLPGLGVGVWNSLARFRDARVRTL